MTTDREKITRRRELDRERGRRYRERHPDRVRALAADRAAEYRARNPEAFKAAQKRYADKARTEINSDLYTAVSQKADRFRELVSASGLNDCWPWQGWVSRNGYGGFTIASGRWITASRAALMLKLGRNLQGGMFACHTCDNPSCCNPTHLYEGTPRQNAADKGARGRHTPRCGVKINEEIARQIFDEEGSHSAIARKYGVSRTMVHNIKTGKSWRRIHTALTAGTITHG